MEWKKMRKDARKDRIQNKVIKLRDSMDVIRARSKTFKDERDIHAEEVLANLDELELNIKELKNEIKRGKKKEIIKDASMKWVQNKVIKLRDSMDVIRARSKTFKDERDIHAEEVLANLDELELNIKELKNEIKRGKKEIKDAL